MLRRCLPVLLSAALLLACNREPKLMRVEIDVTGMTCDACVEAITHEVKRLDGVRTVEVDLEGGKATVVYDAHEAEPEEFEKTIEAIGYGAEPGTPSPDASSH